VIPGVTRAYLSLGSNLGDRLAHLAEAVRRLSTSPGVNIAGASPVYETEPLGADGAVLDGQPAYLNCAVAVDVTLTPDELRSATLGVERAMGRGEHGKWESRTIDIDIVLYGDTAVSTPAVTVPHVRMHERAFVIKPLLDLDPSLSAPGIGPLAALLPKVSAQGISLFSPVFPR